MPEGSVEAPAVIGDETERGKAGVDRAMADRPVTRGAAVRIALGIGIAATTAIAYRGLFDLGSGPPSDLRGAERLLFEPTASSPQLVVGATAWLLVARQSRLRAAVRAGERSALGLLLLAAAFAFLAWAHYVSSPELLVPSLSLLLLGGALWLGGRRGLRAMLLPGLFLLFLIPIPVALVNRFMYPLQIAMADVTSAMLRAVGIGVTSHGDLMSYGGHLFQVIEACSGVRITETIFMSSFLYVEIFWRNRLQSILLVLISPLVGLAANVVRIATIVLNPLSHIAAVHAVQGLAMIVIAVFALALLDSLLTRWLGNRVDPPRERAPDRGPVPLVATLVLLVFTMGMAGTTFALHPWKLPAEPAQTPLSALPARLGGGGARRLDLDAQFLGSASFAEWIHRRYESGDGHVDVLIGASPRLDTRVDFLSPKIDLPGAGWIVEERRVVRVPGIDADVVRSRVQDRLGTSALVYRWFEGVDAPGVELARSLLSLDRSALRRPGRALVVRLVTPIEKHAGGEASAQARLDRFAIEANTFLHRPIPPG